MLRIENLNISLKDEQLIVSNLNMSVPAGELHIIMGPNGSGKTTLAQSLAGHPSYEVKGIATLLEQDLLTLSPQEKAHLGLFVAFQNPVSIPGVSLITFLKTIVNAHRVAKKELPIDAADFLDLARQAAERVGLDESFLYRNCNDGFSGGEKKRVEMLQLILLQPKLIFLDETDSGLDRDAFALLTSLIHEMQSPERSWIVITHYDHFLDALKPDCVHVMWKGRILMNGSADSVRAALQKASGYQGLATDMGVV